MRKKLLAAFAVGAIASFAGLSLVPAASSRLGPSTVRVRAYPGLGNTELRIAPLGSVTARTQKSPITLEMALQEVHVEQLGPLATTPEGREKLQYDVENDLRPLIIRSALQLGLGMIAIGIIAGALFFRRELRPSIAAGTGALIVTVGVLVSVASTYDIDGFREPRFTGSLQRARGVIDALQQNVGLLDQARTRYEVASRRAADLLTLLAKPNEDPFTETTAILHVSDIHGNPIGLDVADELATEFDVDAIVDTGDLASSTLDTGELSRLTAFIEGPLITKIGQLPAPYIFVAGNHDSFELRNALRTAENIEYLDGDSAFVGGIELFGWADPTYSPEDVDASDKAEVRLEEAPDVAAAVADAAPDVLLVHDPRLASESFGEVPLILAGHMHARSFEQEGTTTILTVGSTGATGLNSFTVEADRPYEAEIIYFEGDVPVAMDYITVGALGSEFQLERKVIENPEEES
jgi:predicted phosphodiesterase